MRMAFMSHTLLTKVSVQIVVFVHRYVPISMMNCPCRIQKSNLMQHGAKTIWSEESARQEELDLKSASTC